jgi:plastocyanin
MCAGPVPLAMRRALLLTLALPALLLAGCSDGGNGGDGADVPGAALEEIAIHGNQYDPTTASLAAGGTLRFENHDDVRHTAQTQDGRHRTGDILTGQHKDIAGLPAGTYQFTCQYHPSMRLTVTVA